MGLYTASGPGMLSHRGPGLTHSRKGSEGLAGGCVHVGQATNSGKRGLSAVAGPAVSEEVVSKASAGMDLHCVRWWRPRWPGELR